MYQDDCRGIIQKNLSGDKMTNMRSALIKLSEDDKKQSFLRENGQLKLKGKLLRKEVEDN